ncbi:hypothetical protein [Cryobacterium sp. GrIS_2_6]|uniref:hypothetical protein n=1 Tax=Cryobacterium sp. GrIS_2_6 TaxID=3162785 RepID=UPI002E09E091|nr:hypothetical protein [Cryobacterium psychrotolerans]
MTRLKQPQIIEDLKQLRTDVDELKRTQLISGDSLFGYLTQSSNQNDYSFSLGAYAKRTLVVTFTPATPNNSAIVEMMQFNTVNQPMVLPNAVPPWADSTYSDISFVQKLPPIGNASRWRICAQDYSGSARTVYLKFIFDGTDTGTWTVV